MRALLGFAVLSGGCDLLFQIDHLNGSDAGAPSDGKAQGTIGISARAASAGAGLNSALTLVFDAVAPKPSDTTIVAICFTRGDPLATVTDVMDAHAHGLTHLLTTETPSEHGELWYGRAEGNLLAHFDPEATGPDMRAIAYSGIDQVAVPPAVGGTVTTSKMMTAGPLPYDAALDVLVAATCVAGMTTDIAGFTQQLEVNGNWLADLQANGPDSLTVIATQLDPSQGVLQVAALPAAE